MRANILIGKFGDVVRSFQSTPSYEGELPALRAGRSCNKFQSTPSYEGERGDDKEFCEHVLFQSTPSYEGEHARRAGGLQ